MTARALPSRCNLPSRCVHTSDLLPRCMHMSDLRRRPVRRLDLLRARSPVQLRHGAALRVAEAATVGAGALYWASPQR